MGRDWEYNIERDIIEQEPLRILCKKAIDFDAWRDLTISVPYLVHASRQAVAAMRLRASSGVEDGF